MKPLGSYQDVAAGHRLEPGGKVREVEQSPCLEQHFEFAVRDAAALPQALMRISLVTQSASKKRKACGKCVLLGRVAWLNHPGIDPI
jgi:hypothetical protein